MRRTLPLSLLLAATACAATAGPVQIQLSNVGPTGRLFVNLCSEAELAGHGCRRGQVVAPHAGQTVVNFVDVPPGRYQASAFQDIDNNGRLSFGMMGAPTEPWGYSRNAKAVMGPPPSRTPPWRSPPPRRSFLCALASPTPHGDEA